MNTGKLPARASVLSQLACGSDDSASMPYALGILSVCVSMLLDDNVPHAMVRTILESNIAQFESTGTFARNEVK